MMFLVHITSHDPVSFTINYEPKADPEKTTESFLQSLGVVPQHFAPHPRVACLLCNTDQDTFEKVREHLIEKDAGTIVLDSSHDEVGLIQQGYESLIGFAKKVPEPITSDQVLAINPNIFCTADKLRTELHPTVGMATSILPASVLQLNQQ